MRDKSLVLLIVFVVLFSVVASGCLGGGGSGTSSTTSSVPPETSGSSSGTQYSTSSETPSPSASSSGSGTTTSSAISTWKTPWDAYDRVRVNGRDYYVVAIRYEYAVKDRKNNGRESRFEVEKERGPARIHVYSSEGGKTDLGTFNVFAYHGKITPLTGANGSGSKGALEYWIFVTNRTKDTDSYFLTPILDFGPLISGNIVGMDVVCGDKRFFWTNPAAVGIYDKSSYSEGNLDDVLSCVNVELYRSWVVLTASTVWNGIEGTDLMRPREYTWSGMGISYHYKVSPDGSVTFDGRSFRTSNVEWRYSIMGSTAMGKAKIAPALPVPVEAEGSFVGMGTAPMWSHLRIEDLKLSPAFEALSYEGLTVTETSSTTSGTSETSTSTTSTGSSAESRNWKLAWDASRPVSIDGTRYLITGVTWNVTVKKGQRVWRFLVTKGYREAKLNGKNVYVVHDLITSKDGTWNITAYVSQGYLEAYTGGALWMPSLNEFGSDYIKLIVTGPNCHYWIDDEGNMNGTLCQYDEGVNILNQIWVKDTGFYGGIYGDVVRVSSLSSGNGYRVERDGSVKFSGITFDLYKVTWSGSFSGVPASGVTYVAPKLPFPVRIEAALSPVGTKGYYTKASLVNLVLRPVSGG